MVVSAMKYLCSVFLLLLFVGSAFACFGPKLFVGTAPGEEGELRFHLVAIYLHEKTGIECSRLVLDPGQDGLSAITEKQVDLAFSVVTQTEVPVVLELADGIRLLSGDRPLNDLQFSTVGRAFTRLQKKLADGRLTEVRQAIVAGALPATAVRDFMLKNGWI